MAIKRYLLAIDQGTTSSKALVVDESGGVRAASGNFAISARFPEVGWVEFDPREMLDSVISAARDAINRAGISASEIAGIGLANQGETVIAFDGETGEPIAPSISWQDRRTGEIIERWRAEGLESEIARRTGLRLDPYFSAGKMRWVLNNLPDAKALLRAGWLRLGSSDGWLLQQLTGRFVTDPSTASRTSLLNLETLQWDETLEKALAIPGECLPEIVPNAEFVGETRAEWLGRAIPITGLCVDQQAALFGQGCLREGQAKATYGTGCFVLANLGSAGEARRAGLLTSVGWRLCGRADYVFDGGIYSAGSILNWLRDELRLFSDFAELEALARGVDDTGGVLLFPAFAGLASPHWEPNARAGLFGMTLGTKREHLLRAALEAIAFRVKEIVDAMNGPGLSIGPLQIDGGLTANDFLMQLQADLLGISLLRGENAEATSLGVAKMAGLGAGLYRGLDELPLIDPPSRVFEPRDGPARERLLDRYAEWRERSREMIRWGKQGKES